MAVAFYIPSVDEEEPVKPNHPQQVGQQQHQQQSFNQTTSSDLSQQVCAEAEAVAELQRHHLMVVFHEILVAYAREAALAQHSPNPKALPTTEPCLLCKKLYYLFRRFY